MTAEKTEHAPAARPLDGQPTFGLIVIGDEILSGKRQDKHLPHFVELLAERGLHLSWAEYVGDEPPRITATLTRHQTTEPSGRR